MIENKLDLFVYPTSNFQTAILGDKATSCDGKCNKVELIIDDYKLIYSMCSMVIGGEEIVLGYQCPTSIRIAILNLQINS
jgi:hypothetical protein